MAVWKRNAQSQPDIKNNEIEETGQKETAIEKLLAEASESQRRQMDAAGVFVSEELIAATMQKLEQAAKTDATQSKPFQHRTMEKKQLGRIVSLVAALFAVVLLAGGGAWMLSGSMANKNATDGAGMQEANSSGKYDTDAADANMNVANVNSAGYPTSMENPKTENMEETVLLLQKPEGEENLGGVEQSGLLTAETGTVPQLLYEDKAFLTVEMAGAEGVTLQIVFDEPQNFLYSCGREGERFYLLAARETAAGRYEQRLLLFDWEEGKTKTWELDGEEDGLVSWISLRDGELFYECGDGV